MIKVNKNLLYSIISYLVLFPVAKNPPDLIFLVMILPVAGIVFAVRGYRVSESGIISKIISVALVLVGLVILGYLGFFAAYIYAACGVNQNC